jgi:hypothetical protein
LRRYKDLGTDLKKLFEDISYEIRKEPKLNIVSEMHGEVNGLPMMSIMASRSSIPKILVGTLREITVTITGVPDDFLIEMHVGEWLRNLVLPHTDSIILVGPLTGLAVAGSSRLLAVTFGREMKLKIKELVKKHSRSEYSDDKIETFIN